MTSDEFYEEMLSDNNSIYLAADVSLLCWSYTGPFKWGFSGLCPPMPIFGNLSKIEEMDEGFSASLGQVLMYGHFKNITVYWPTNKSENASYENTTFRVFNLEDVLKINFSTVEYPTNVTVDEEIEIIETITNPFEQPITLVLTLGSLNNFNLSEGNAMICDTFYPQETKTFRWKLKAINSGFKDIEIRIFGKNEDKKVWIGDSCRFEISESSP